MGGEDVEKDLRREWRTFDKDSHITPSQIFVRSKSGWNIVDHGTRGSSGHAEFKNTC